MINSINPRNVTLSLSTSATCPTVAVISLQSNALIIPTVNHSGKNQ